MQWFMPSHIHLATVNHMAQPGVYTSYQNFCSDHQYQKVCAVVPAWHSFDEWCHPSCCETCCTNHYVWQCDPYSYFYFLMDICCEQHNACKYACAYNNPFAISKHLYKSASRSLLLHTQIYYVFLKCTSYCICKLKQQL